MHRIVFHNVKAYCRDCGEPVSGHYKIGDDYYCAGDYNRYFDKEIEREKEKERRESKKIINKAING